MNEIRKNEAYYFCSDKKPVNPGIHQEVCIMAKNYSDMDNNSSRNSSRNEMENRSQNNSRNNSQNNSQNRSQNSSQNNSQNSSRNCHQNDKSEGQLSGSVPAVIFCNSSQAVSWKEA